MMQIKFRGYCEMCEKMYMLCDLSFRAYDGGLEASCGKKHSYTEVILKQYTGLKDTNGKEIFQGDILRWRLSDADDWETYQIKWGDDYPAFEIYPNTDWEYNGLQFITSIEGECEIIGNIYENPELLEG